MVPFFIGMGKKLGGREYLIKRLKKRHGVSRRRAVEILDRVFAEIKDALGRGEEVEFALGKLKVERHKHRTQTGQFLNRKLTIYKRPFTVVLETDRKGEWLLTPIVLPPKPGSPPGAKRIVINPRPGWWNLKLPPKPWLKRAK